MSDKHDRQRAVLARFAELNCVFVHVPKTAGFSITKQLFHGLATEHTEARVWQSLVPTGDWNRRFKFAFVRNPSDRFISAFWYLKSGGLHIGDRSWAEENLHGIRSAEELMELPPRKLVPLLDWIHFRPMRSFVCDRRGTVLLDFIGRYETLQSDYSAVLDALNLTQSPLVASNVTPYHREEFAQWSSKNQDLLYRLYSDDYRIFGY